MGISELFVRVVCKPHFLSRFANFTSSSRILPQICFFTPDSSSLLKICVFYMEFVYFIPGSRILLSTLRILLLSLRIILPVCVFYTGLRFTPGPRFYFESTSFK